MVVSDKVIEFPKKDDDATEYQRMVKVTHSLHGDLPRVLKSQSGAVIKFHNFTDPEECSDKPHRSPLFVNDANDLPIIFMTYTLADGTCTAFMIQQAGMLSDRLDSLPEVPTPLFDDE